MSVCAHAHGDWRQIPGAHLYHLMTQFLSQGFSLNPSLLTPLIGQILSYPTSQTPLVSQTLHVLEEFISSWSGRHDGRTALLHHWSGNRKGSADSAGSLQHFSSQFGIQARIRCHKPVFRVGFPSSAKPMEISSQTHFGLFNALGVPYPAKLIIEIYQTHDQIKIPQCSIQIVLHFFKQTIHQY